MFAHDGLALAQGIVEVSPHGNVAPTGSYLQRVPLDVPAYHGLEPAVELVYDSSNRDGAVGWGWRLSVSSSINRVSRRSGVPHLDFTDQYLLDGELLIPCEDQSPYGVSCANGGTHGVEHETFQRVQRDGDQNWRVWDRNGVVARYEPSGSNSLKSVRWDLASRTDTSGNEVEYHYWCDGKDECYLGDIEYHDGPTALRTHISIHWELRPAEAVYAVGAADLVHIRYRLKNLLVTTDGKPRNALNIVYRGANSGRWSDASLLSEVVRYGSDVQLDGAGLITGGTHLPSETFGDYSAAPPAAKAVQLSLLPPVAPTSSKWAPSHFVTAVPWVSGVAQGGEVWSAIDVDGDGLDDAVAVVPDGSSNPSGAKLVVQLNRGDGTFSAPATPISTSWTYWFPPTPTVFAGPTPPDRGQVFLAGDFNGDGLKDLLAIWADADGNVKAQIAFGSTNVNHMRLGAIQNLPVPAWQYRHKWLVGDFDGDGRSDLAIVEAAYTADGCNPEEAGCTIPRIHFLRSDGASLIETNVTDAPWSNFGPDSPYWFVGDVDGDGRSDIIRVMRTGDNIPLATIGVGLSNGAGFSYSSFPTNTSWNGRFIFDRPNPNFIPTVNDMAQVGDFDGNGLTDVAILTGRVANSSFNFDHIVIHTFLSQGAGLNTFEREGHETETGLNVMLTNAYSGAGVLYKGIRSFPNRWLSMDVNRDGVTDLVVVTAPGISGIPWPQPVAQVVTIISNRDGSFQSPVERDINMLFNCWDVSDQDECAGGPRFQVMPAELNGDQEQDLLFAQFGTSSGFVELESVPAADDQDAAANWRLADISGDGRLDAVKIQGLGDSIRIQSFILPQMGIGSPFVLQAGVTPPVPVSQTVSTAGVPLAGVDISHWFVADIDSPEGNGPDGRADLIYQSVDSSGTGLPKRVLLELVSKGDGSYIPRIQPGPSLSGGKSNLWKLGDFDGDGRLTPGRVTLVGPGQLTVEVQGRQPISVAAPGIDTTAGFVVADLDGDGLADFVMVQSTPLPDGSTTSNVVALLGMGSGFRFVSWPLPAEAAGIPARAWRPADLNGDGKSDLVAAIPDSSGYERIAGLLFTGSSWVFQDESLPQTIAASGRVVNVADFNGDGCSDLAWKDSINALVQRYTWLINHCDGSFEKSTGSLTATPGATYPLDSGGNGIDRYATSWQAADLAGAGRANLITIRNAATPNAVLITPYDSQVGPGLLGGVSNGIGFSSSITYDTTTGALGRTRFAQPLNVVSSVRFASMSASAPFVSHYTYSGARWSLTRRFLGFESISVLSGQSGSAVSNNNVRTEYEQTEGCAMQPKRIATLRATSRAGPLYSDSFSYIDPSLTLADAPWVCEVQRTSHSDCELKKNCHESQVDVRHYDQFGNVIELDGVGDPQDPTDDRKLTTWFLPPNASNYLVSLPYEVEVKDAVGSRVSDTQIFYDYALSHTQIPTVGNPTKTDNWDPVNGTLSTQRSFDVFGNVTQVTDAAGHVTTRDWDPTFSRFPIQDCNSHWCVTHGWDLVLGLKTLETDANGQQVHTVFDPLRRHKRTDYPDGGCLIHDYMQWGPQSDIFDFSNQKVVETECSDGSTAGVAIGPSHTIYFDGLQRIWKEERSGGYQMFRSFDGWKSNPKSESLWQTVGSPRVTTSYTYDDAQRLVLVEFPDGQHSITSYDIDAVIQTSPTGGVRRIVTDGWNRIKSVSDDVMYHGARVAATAKFKFDALDHLRSATDANGHATQFSWSPLGWSSSVCRPDTGCQTRTFWNTGLVRSEQDALGQHIEYDYDDLARLAERRQYDRNGVLLETSKWEYDRAPLVAPNRTPVLAPSGAPGIAPNRAPRFLPIPYEANMEGRLRRVSSTAGTSTDFSYDNMGRVSQRSDCVTGDCISMKFNWNLLGRIDSITYPDDTGVLSPSSETVTYKYDDAGRIETIAPYITQIAYEPDDKIHSIQFNQGVVQTMSYDDNRRWMKSMEVDGPQGGGTVGLSGQIAKWTYDYYADGRLKGELRRGLVSSQRAFNYDPSGRLLGVNSGSPQSYDYDRAGNIIRYNTETYAYADPSHPNGVTTAGNVILSYDADGQIISRNGTPIEWDPLGRISQVGTGASALTYVYSSDGALARRQAGNDTAVYFNPYVERLSYGLLARNYLLAGDIFARRDPFGVQYFHHDRLGSVTEMTQDNGVAAELYQYDAWGVSTATMGRDNEFRFASGRQDKDTGLIRMGARSLDPSLGRFISADPKIARPERQLDLNPYVYAQDDPINSTDTTGMQVDEDDETQKVNAELVTSDSQRSTSEENVNNVANPAPSASEGPPAASNRSEVPNAPEDAVQAAIDTRLGEILHKMNVEKGAEAAIEERATEILRRMNAARENKKLDGTRELKIYGEDTSPKLSSWNYDMEKARELLNDPDRMAELEEYGTKSFWNAFHITLGTYELNFGHVPFLRWTGGAAAGHGIVEQLELWNQVKPRAPDAGTPGGR
jgi:RHS repeat-associated protein